MYLRESSASANVFQDLCQQLIDAYDADNQIKTQVIINSIRSELKRINEPSLLERALNGDANAAKQFLFEAELTDQDGNLLPQYQSLPEDN